MKKLLIFIGFIVVLGIGCSSITPSTATPVIESPTAVKVSTMSVTVPPSSTPTEDVPFEDKITILVAAEDYSVEVPFSLLSEVDGNDIMVTNEQDDFFIRFTIDPNEENDPLAALLDKYFAALETRGMVVTQEPAYEINVNGSSGLRVDFLGMSIDPPMAGSAVVVPAQNDLVLIGFGLSKLQQDKDAWTNKGLPNFDKLIKSVKFVNSEAECPISTDETYGYSEENPIKVGGGDFGGPSREQVYLNHLLDSQGKAITYDRSGSTMVGSVILDVYVLSTSNGDVTLYIDEYNYTPLQAPVNFTCEGEFPLAAP